MSVFAPDSFPRSKAVARNKAFSELRLSEESAESSADATGVMVRVEMEKEEAPDNYRNSSKVTTTEE